MMTKIIQIDDSFYQHQRLGRKVLKALIDLARQKGWRNESSRNLSFQTCPRTMF